MDNVTDKNPVNSNDGETPFHFAAKHGQLAICQLMLENLSTTQAIGKWKIGPNKNPGNKINGLTPLHYAAESGYVEVCKLIMKNLVNKHPRCKNGSTPLSRAMYSGKMEVCLLFHEFKRCLKCKGGIVNWKSPKICKHIEPSQ